jgi:hypothetical protein
VWQFGTGNRKRRWRTRVYPERENEVLFCLLAAGVRTAKGESGALVNGHISNPLHRLRSLPAATLVVFRKYLIVVPRPLPAAPLVVRRRYLIVVHRTLPRCASQVLGHGA